MPQPAFPKPIRISANCARWRLSELLRFDADLEGREPVQLSEEQERYMSARDVARRYGVSTASVYRWATRTERNS